MKRIIDIDEDYFEIIKHDVIIANADYKPFLLIAKSIPYEERPQGEWIPIRLLMEDNYHSRLSFRCNQCRYVEGYRAKYCAGCGAFMRAEDIVKAVKNLEEHKHEA